MTTPKHAAPKPKRFTLKRRRYLYGVALAVGAVALSFGLIAEEQVAPLLGLAAALLGVTGTALANPTED